MPESAPAHISWRGVGKQWGGTAIEQFPVKFTMYAQTDRATTVENTSSSLTIQHAHHNHDASLGQRKQRCRLYVHWQSEHTDERQTDQFRNPQELVIHCVLLPKSVETRRQLLVAYAAIQTYSH